jgi:magnesium-transporting ATPase (P-type)
MSLIVKQGKEIYLLCKGADSIVLPRCVFLNSQERDTKIITEEQLRLFAIEGLRTLVMGKKLLTQA